MNKTLGLLLIVCICSVWAAEATRYDNNVALEVPPMFNANLNISYERALSDMFSVVAGVDIAPIGSLALELGENSWANHSDYGVYGGVNLYPVKRMEALFIQIYGAYYLTHFKEKDWDGNVIPDENTVIAPGMMVGWKFRVADKATICLGGGSGYDSNTDNVKARLSAMLGVFF
jgi:hypothetical protein